MTPALRQRLPFILTGVLVALAVAAVAIFLAVGGTSRPGAGASPTPTRAAGSGSEVLPPTATATTPHLGVSPTPLISPPLPKTASAQGKLVAGFPSTVIPLPDGVAIVSSSVSTDGDRLQATLVATSPASQGDVAAFYQASFTKLGMTGAVSPASPGTEATTYTRGADAITVTTSTDSGHTRVTLFGRFTAGKG